MALRFRTWWQEAIASTIVWGGMYYLTGLVYRRHWSLTEFAVATSSWGMSYAAMAWYGARRRKTVS
jgi:hypothetical protein